MSSPEVPASWLAGRIAGSRTRDICAGVAGLIQSGELPAGARLPTIRALALELRAKVSAVTDAWVQLRQEGLVETRRRGGTLVTGPRATAPRPGRVPFSGWSGVETLHALPDVLLVPDTSAFFAASVDPGRPLDLAFTIDPALGFRLMRSWPFESDAFAVLPSGSSALQLVLHAALAGTRSPVAVEMPAMTRFTDIVNRLVLTGLSVDSDAEGPRPESLARALRDGARTFVYQPSAQVPRGSRLTAGRRDELAEVLAAYRDSVYIIEDDPFACLYDHVSLGTHFPERTVRICQYWRAFGGDLNVTVVGGSPQIIDHVRMQQRATGVRVSGLLQDVLEALLGDSGALSQARAAGEIYARRNLALAEALTRHGCAVDSYGGCFAWVPVRSELAAVTDLAVRGIRVQAGDGAYFAGRGEPHIRVATTRLPDAQSLVDDFAAAIAGAASSRPHVDAGSL